MTSIGSYAFYDCSALETVTFGDNSQLESIGSFAFYDCSALETVTFGANSQLESIGNYAFRYCSNLTSIEIPSSVTSIGNNAFQDCSLETVTFEDTESVWVLNDTSYDITISEHTPQELATYLTNTYRDCTWTKKQ